MKEESDLEAQSLRPTNTQPRRNTEAWQHTDRLPWEKPGPESGRLMLSVFTSSCCIVLFAYSIDYRYTWIDNPADLAAVFFCLSYYYFASLVTHACLYIRGFVFPLTKSASDSREDQLLCVKENITAWVQYTAKSWESDGSEAFAKRIGYYQKGFAWYLANPSALFEDGGEYWRRSHLGTVMIIIGMHYIFGRGAQIAAHAMRTDDHFKLGCWAGGVCYIMFYALQYMLMNGFLHSDAGRYGRGLRMSALARKIRCECLRLEGEGEGAESQTEELRWWIENLVRYSDLEEEKVGQKKEGTVTRMIKASQERSDRYF